MSSIQRGCQGLTGVQLGGKLQLEMLMLANKGRTYIHIFTYQQSHLEKKEKKKREMKIQLKNEYCSPS